MYSAKSLLLIASGASQVAAQTPTAPTQIVMTSSTSQAATSQSQTTIVSATQSLPPYGSACLAAFKSTAPKMTDRPVPGEDIYDIALSWGKGELYNTQNPCELPSVTGENAAKFTTWASAWNDWSYDHIPEFQELWKACSDDPEVTGIVPIGSDVCSDLSARVTGVVGDEDKGGDEDEDGDKPATVVVSAGSLMEGSIALAMMAAGMVLVVAY